VSTALLLMASRPPALAWGPAITAASDGDGAGAGPGPAPDLLAARVDRPPGPSSTGNVIEVGDGERVEPLTLTRQAMLDLALRYMAEMSLSVQQGQDMRRQAEIGKDLIKLSCIAEQLAQMKEIKRRLDEHLGSTSMQSAKLEEIRFDFVQVAIGTRQMRSLRSQLAQCVGKNFESVSVTEVTVDEPSTGFDGHDAIRPGGFGQVPTPIMERPPAASRYQ
jgi:hypothetical protein